MISVGFLFEKCGVIKREISEFNTQFAGLTEFDTQFACLSKFGTETANSFDLGVSHLFSLFSLFYIFFLVSRPHEKTKLPLTYPFTSRLLSGPHDCSQAPSQACVAASQACMAVSLSPRPLFLTPRLLRQQGLRKERQQGRRREMGSARSWAGRRRREMCGLGRRRSGDRGGAGSCDGAVDLGRRR